jgi:quercetin dioxygenase-like cupin family protein
MTKTSLVAVAQGQLDQAHAGPERRSCLAVHERQTVMALLANEHLHEQQHGWAATAQVLRSRVRLVAGRESWEAGPGDLLLLPYRRHRVEAVEDSVVLLTVSVGRVDVQPNG